MKDFLRRAIGPWLFGLVLGGALASGYWVHEYRQLYNGVVTEDATGRIIEDVTTLSSIRNQGKEETIAFKEDELSDGIWALSVAFSPSELSDTNSLKALKLAAAYRRQHPFSTGDTNKDHAVENFLANFKTN